MTAPERIWWNPAGHWSSFDDSEIRYDPSVEYTRTDLCIPRAEHEAAVAAAYEAAAEDVGAWGWDQLDDGAAIRGMVMDDIRALTPADARASLDRMLAQAREERDAAVAAAYEEGHDYAVREVTRAVSEERAAWEAWATRTEDEMRYGLPDRPKTITYLEPFMSEGMPHLTSDFTVSGEHPIGHVDHFDYERAANAPLDAARLSPTPVDDRIGPDAGGKGE
jgi:hypothetical protein